MSTSSTVLQKRTQKNFITEYILTTNNLRVLFVPRPGTGVITSNIVYFVGSRDEARGETGLAHMLEHMLFKPTVHDVERGTDSAAMYFEQEYGIVVNANTWKDRTSYYFTYPKEHFDRALKIEAERMHGVILTDETLRPEQGNVLSEFDMYAGDEFFSLSAEMYDAAFRSHPYAHETIGYREDIEAYTSAALQSFYDRHYSPENAVLIVVGDVSETDLITAVTTHFASIPTQKRAPRLSITEPKQEGLRTVSIKRHSTKNILGIGVKHDAFPKNEWFETLVVMNMLAGGQDSILYKKFVDTGKLSHISVSFEESREANLGIFFCTLTKKSSHEKVYAEILSTIQGLTTKDIAPYLKKTIAHILMGECTSRENSQSLAAELVEYVSADAWERFFESESIIKAITPAAIKRRIERLFAEENTTLGYFNGTK